MISLTRSPAPSKPLEITNRATRAAEILAELEVIDRMRQRAELELAELGERTAHLRSHAPRLVSLKQAARLVNRHPDTLRRWPQFETFAARVGGRIAVDLDRFEDVIKDLFARP